ncbi:DUF3108 domain-containing protein [Thiobacillus sp.]|uniref:DUF3108 domain-containing protein n=1 Tax=Thiobacillus sp. TaxID=924 RepID=UPI0025E5C7FC|nr:DUF3108 domain-containing protein [Thiobacillus sp.]MBT9538448.1 DUF3108 domain-containing protein [Thiobacillus sp.]
MSRRIRPWGLALVGSLLLHAALFGGLRWELPQWREPPEAPPLDVRLATAPKVAPKPVEPPAARVPAPKPPPARPPARVHLQPPARVAAPEPEPIIVPVAEPLPPTVAEPGESAPEVATPAVPELPPLNVLPPRLDLRYRLSYGIASGQQTLVWVNEGERYTLTSVAAATGVAGMFYRGHFAQTSRGRITTKGLQPEEFWDQRGKKHSRATFDAGQGQIVLVPDKGAPRQFSYEGEVQDALSLFFQFALTAPPSGEQLAYTVFNGKKLRNYRYEVLGEVQLDTRLGVLRTLHLKRADAGDGRFEIWLAIERYYLPVRMQRSDEGDSVMQLDIESITP